MNRCFSNGDVIGDYRLTGYCGGGGFGEVWLAETLTGGWPFALKIINDREKGEKELTGLSKFKACQHSHLIRIHHIGTTPDGRLYYTMDRADNAGSPEQYTADTLEYRIRKKKLSPEECYILAGKIAEALGCMHDNGLIHRDVKPGNIIFCNGEPVLADIGLVTVASPEVSLAGTPGFVPYYIFDGSHDPCPESDFYALGVTLKCALAGTADPQQALRYNDYSGSFSGKNGDLLRLWSQLSQSSKDFNRTTIHSAGDFVRCLKGEASGAVPETAGNLPEKKNHYYWNIAIVLSLLGLCVVGILIYISREKKETAVQRTGGEKNSVIKNTPPAKSKTQLEPVPVKKAEDMPEIRKLLEKYGWFSRRVASAQDPFVARQIESVKNYLQKITVQGRVQQGGEELRQLEEKYLRTWQQAEWAWTAKQMPEVKKLLDEFKLSPEEEKVAAGDYRFVNVEIQGELAKIGRSGRVNRKNLDSLKYYLNARKNLVKVTLRNIPRKIPAGKKAEDMPEIRKLLKKYGWFNTAAKAEIEKNGSGVYHSYFSYVPQIRNTLQKMTQSRQYTQDDLNRLENYYLASFRNEIKSAEDILRIKQHPEVKAVLSKFAFSEQYAAKYANRMSAVLLRQMANKKKITNSEFEQWRWWREHEWKEYRATLAKENKLPVMVPDREKIFSKSDEFLIKFRYFENNNWSESTFSVSGIENEEQMEKKVLSSPVFRFDKTMEFQIYSAEKVSGSVGEYNVIYLFRKDKKAGWQTLQRKMKSVPTVKIARNALFMQHIINDPECEIRIQRLERPAPAPVSFRYTSPVLTQKNEAVRYIDLSDVFSIPFSTEALLRNRNNRYLAEFYNFWSSEYVQIPPHIQNKLAEKIKIWQQKKFSKIPPSDAAWAEFVRRELDLVRKANAYCVRYGRPHTLEDSKKDFSGLVLAAELRRVALLQLESQIKNSKVIGNSETVGVPAVRYNQTWR